MLSPCAKCNLLFGAGMTFAPYAWTDGVIFPVLFEIDESRWELGAYRFATSQRFAEHGLENVTSAGPFWGFTAMHRWQLLHRGSGRYYFGFGANWRTEPDWLTATRWNFAYTVAARGDLGHGALVELSLRHWSNAWIKLPNRGINMLMLTFGF